MKPTFFLLLVRLVIEFDRGQLLERGQGLLQGKVDDILLEGAAGCIVYYSRDRPRGGDVAGDIQFYAWRPIANANVAEPADNEREHFSNSTTLPEEIKYRPSPSVPDL